MSHYMVQVTYAPESWNAWLAHPQHSCKGKIEALAAQLGGHLHGFWHTTGEVDTIILLELPDDRSALAMSAFLQSTGGLASFQVTPLLTDEDFVQAMGRAAGAAGRQAG